MMHRHQRLLRGKGKAFGKVYPHQHCADKPGRKRDGHCVYLLCGKAGLS